jgi:TPR repeat protein
MNRAIVLALTVSAIGLAAPAAAQDEAGARLLGGTAAPPLSVRAMPAAPPVHKLSIGPLSAPADEAVVAPRSEGAARSQAATRADGTVADATLEGLVRRADSGDAESNYRLGLRHLAGEGVTRDFVEAFARIRLAAEAGHPRAISLFYSMGARLTAEEHGKAYLRTQELRPTARAAR